MAMHTFASSVAETATKSDFSDDRIRAEVLPNIFDPAFVAAEKAAGHVGLLMDVGSLYLKAKVAEEEALTTASAADHAYSDDAVRRRRKAHHKFSPENFQFVCNELGLRSVGVIDAFFQSIDVEVDDVISAQQLYEWIMIMFAPAVDVNAESSGGSTAGTSADSPGGSSNHLSAGEGGIHQRQAQFAYQFLDFGHSGRLRTRHIIRSIRELVCDLTRFDIDEAHVGRIVRALLGSRVGQGRPRRDSTRATSPASFVSSNGDATLGAISEQKTEGHSGDESDSDCADPAPDEHDVVAKENITSNESWSSVVLHPAPPCPDRSEAPMTKSVFVDLVAHPPRRDGSWAMRVPQVPVAAIGHANSKPRPLPTKCLQLQGRLVELPETRWGYVWSFAAAVEFGVVEALKYLCERNKSLPQLDASGASGPALDQVFEMPLSDQSWRFAKAVRMPVGKPRAKKTVPVRSAVGQAMARAGGLARRVGEIASKSWRRLKNRGLEADAENGGSSAPDAIHISPTTSPTKGTAQGAGEDEPPLTVQCKRCGFAIPASMEAIEAHQDVCGKENGSTKQGSVPSAPGIAAASAPTRVREIHAILPEVYHNIRSLFGISSRAFLQSQGLRGVLQATLSGHFASLAGRSSPHRDLGHTFASMDGRFFCQVLTENQRSRLMAFIEPYYNHVRRNRGTQLFRLVGHFRVLAVPAAVAEGQTDEGTTGSSNSEANNEILRDFTFVVFQNPVDHSVPASVGAALLRKGQGERAGQPDTSFGESKGFRGELHDAGGDNNSVELLRRYEIAGSPAHPMVERDRGRGSSSSRIAPVGDILDFVMEQVQCNVGLPYRSLATSLAADIAFLEAQRLVGYSLLISVTEFGASEQWDNSVRRVAWVAEHRAALQAAYKALRVGDETSRDSVSKQAVGQDHGPVDADASPTDASQSSLPVGGKQRRSSATGDVIPFELFADHIAFLALDSEEVASTSSSLTGSDKGLLHLAAHERQGFLLPDRVGARGFSFSIAPGRDLLEKVRRRGSGSPTQRALRVLKKVVGQDPDLDRAESGFDDSAPERSKPHLVLADSLRWFLHTYVHE